MQRVSLDTFMFDEAVASFIDEYKPDPLVKKQIQKLQFDWREAETIHLHENEFLNRHSSKNIIQGILHISSEYCTVNVDATCVWHNGIETQHEMYFSLNVSATLHDIQSTKFSSIDDKNDRKENRMNKKAHSGVVQRLRGDTLVKRFLDVDQVLLAEAHVKFNCEDPDLHRITKLEERVISSTDSIGGLKTLLFSFMESNIEVLEFLLHLPYLPREKQGASLKPSRELGERVALRLLEDAMLDECEKEGEDDMLEDLNLSDDVVVEQNSKKTKKV